MKKLICLFTLMFTLGLACNPVMAEETSQPEENITEEQTPLAARRNNSQIILFAGMSVLIVLGVGYTIYRKNQFNLFVNNVSENSDGSYTITWGYCNPFYNKKKIDQEPTGFKVSKGSAIILKSFGKEGFQTGVHKSAVVTVVNDETELEWYVGDHRLKVNKEVIKEKFNEKFNKKR